jgi:hypothetical protein
MLYTSGSQFIGLDPLLKIHPEGPIHDLGDAHPFRFRFVLDEFDVPSLHMVGLPLGVPRRTRLDRLQLPVSPPGDHLPEVRFDCIELCRRECTGVDHGWTKGGGQRERVKGR